MLADSFDLSDPLGTTRRMRTKNPHQPLESPALDFDQLGVDSKALESAYKEQDARARAALGARDDFYKAELKDVVEGSPYVYGVEAGADPRAYVDSHFSGLEQEASRVLKDVPSEDEFLRQRQTAYEFKQTKLKREKFQRLDEFAKAQQEAATNTYMKLAGMRAKQLSLPQELQQRYRETAAMAKATSERVEGALDTVEGSRFVDAYRRLGDNERATKFLSSFVRRKGLANTPEQELATAKSVQKVLNDRILREDMAAEGFTLSDDGFFNDRPLGMRRDERMILHLSEAKDDGVLGYNGVPIDTLIQRYGGEPAIKQARTMEMFMETSRVRNMAMQDVFIAMARGGEDDVKKAIDKAIVSGELFRGKAQVMVNEGLDTEALGRMDTPGLFSAALEAFGGVKDAMARAKSSRIQADLISEIRSGEGIGGDRLEYLLYLARADSMRKGSKNYQELVAQMSDDTERNLFEAAGVLLSNPQGMLELSVQSLAAFLPEFLGRALVNVPAGALAGAAAAGVPTAGVGVLPGAGWGAKGGLALSAGQASYALEGVGEFWATLAEEGVDIANPMTVAAALGDKEILEKLRSNTLKKGMPIAVFDALSAGTAGVFTRGVGSPVKAGVRMVRGGAERSLAANVAGKAAQARYYALGGAVADIAAEMGAGMAGEYVGQKIRNPNDPVGMIEVAAEGLLEVTGPALPGNVQAMTKLLRSETYAIQRSHEMARRNNMTLEEAVGNLQTDVAERIRTRIAARPAEAYTFDEKPKDENGPRGGMVASGNQAYEFNSYDSAPEMAADLPGRLGILATSREGRFLKQFTTVLQRLGGEKFRDMKVVVTNAPPDTKTLANGTRVPEGTNPNQPGLYDPVNNILYINPQEARRQKLGVASVFAHEAGHFAEAFGMGKGEVVEMFKEAVGENKDAAMAEYASAGRTNDPKKLRGRELKTFETMMGADEQHQASEWFSLQFARVVKDRIEGMDTGVVGTIRKFLGVYKSGLSDFVGSTELGGIHDERIERLMVEGVDALTLKQRESVERIEEVTGPLEQEPGETQEQDPQFNTLAYSEIFDPERARQELAALEEERTALTAEREELAKAEEPDQARIEEIDTRLPQIEREQTAREQLAGAIKAEQQTLFEEDTETPSAKQASRLDREATEYETNQAPVPDPANPDGALYIRKNGEWMRLRKDGEPGRSRVSAKVQTRLEESMRSGNIATRPEREAEASLQVLEPEVVDDGEETTGTAEAITQEYAPPSDDTALDDADVIEDFIEDGAGIEKALGVTAPELSLVSPVATGAEARVDPEQELTAVDAELADMTEKAVSVEEAAANKYVEDVVAGREPASVADTAYAYDDYDVGAASRRIRGRVEAFNKITGGNPLIGASTLLFSARSFAQQQEPGQRAKIKDRLDADMSRLSEAEQQLREELESLSADGRPAEEVAKDKTLRKKYDSLNARIKEVGKARGELAKTRNDLVTGPNVQGIHALRLNYLPHASMVIDQLEGLRRDMEKGTVGYKQLAGLGPNVKKALEAQKKAGRTDAEAVAAVSGALLKTVVKAERDLKAQYETVTRGLRANVTRTMREAADSFVRDNDFEASPFAESLATASATIAEIEEVLTALQSHSDRGETSEAVDTYISHVEDELSDLREEAAALDELDTEWSTASNNTMAEMTGMQGDLQTHHIRERSQELIDRLRAERERRARDEEFVGNLPQGDPFAGRVEEISAKLNAVDLALLGAESEIIDALEQRQRETIASFERLENEPNVVQERLDDSAATVQDAGAEPLALELARNRDVESAARARGAGRQLTGNRPTAAKAQRRKENLWLAFVSKITGSKEPLAAPGTKVETIGSRAEVEATALSEMEADFNRPLVETAGTPTPAQTRSSAIDAMLDRGWKRWFGDYVKQHAQAKASIESLDAEIEVYQRKLEELKTDEGRREAAAFASRIGVKPGELNDYLDFQLPARLRAKQARAEETRTELQNDLIKAFGDEETGMVPPELADDRYAPYDPNIDPSPDERMPIAHAAFLRHVAETGREVTAEELKDFRARVVHFHNYPKAINTKGDPNYSPVNRSTDQDPSFVGASDGATRKRAQTALRKRLAPYEYLLPEAIEKEFDAALASIDGLDKPVSFAEGPPIRLEKGAKNYSYPLSVLASIVNRAEQVVAGLRGTGTEAAVRSEATMVYKVVRPYFTQALDANEVSVPEALQVLDAFAPRTASWEKFRTELVQQLPEDQRGERGTRMVKDIEASPATAAAPTYTPVRKLNLSGLGPVEAAQAQRARKAQVEGAPLESEKQAYARAEAWKEVLESARSAGGEVSIAQVRDQIEAQVRNNRLAEDIQIRVTAETEAGVTPAVRGFTGQHEFLKIQGTPYEAAYQKHLDAMPEGRQKSIEGRMEAMRLVIQDRFREGTTESKLLRATGNAKLYNDNPFGDYFWGRVNGKGKNTLGTMLERRREYLLRKEGPVGAEESGPGLLGARPSDSDPRVRYNGASPFGDRVLQLFDVVGDIPGFEPGTTATLESLRKAGIEAVVPEDAPERGPYYPLGARPTMQLAEQQQIMETAMRSTGQTLRGVMRLLMGNEGISRAMAAAEDDYKGNDALREASLRRLAGLRALAAVFEQPEYSDLMDRVSLNFVWDQRPASGTYREDTDTITLNMRFAGKGGTNMRAVLMHELVHAATMKGLRKALAGQSVAALSRNMEAPAPYRSLAQTYQKTYATLPNDIRSLVDSADGNPLLGAGLLRALQEHRARNNAPLPTEDFYVAYAMTNIDEFVAATLTTPAFTRYLSKFNASSDTTGLQQAHKAILGALSLPEDSLAAEAVAEAIGVMSPMGGLLGARGPRNPSQIQLPSPLEKFREKLTQYEALKVSTLQAHLMAGKEAGNVLKENVLTKLVDAARPWYVLQKRIMEAKHTNSIEDALNVHHAMDNQKGVGSENLRVVAENFTEQLTKRLKEHRIMPETLSRYLIATFAPIRNRVLENRFMEYARDQVELTAEELTDLKARFPDSPEAREAEASKLLERKAKAFRDDKFVPYASGLNPQRIEEWRTQALSEANETVLKELAGLVHSQMSSDLQSWYDSGFIDNDQFIRLIHAGGGEHRVRTVVEDGHTREVVEMTKDGVYVPLIGGNSPDSAFRSSALDDIPKYAARDMYVQLGRGYGIMDVERSFAKGRFSEPDLMESYGAIQLKASSTAIVVSKAKVDMTVLNLVDELLYGSDTPPALREHAKNLFEVLSPEDGREEVRRNRSDVWTETVSPANDPDLSLLKFTGARARNIAANMEYRDENGQLADHVYVRIKDPRLLRALKNYGMDEMPSWMAMVGKYTGTLARLVTTLNPEFIVPNFVRDFGGAMVNIHDSEKEGLAREITDPKELVRAGKAIFKFQRHATDTAYLEQLNRDPELRDMLKAYNEFREFGGQTGFYDLPSLKDRMQKIQREFESVQKDGKRAKMANVFKAGLKYIEDANTSVENILRLRAFMVARKAGMEPVAAANLARNLTVNFNRRGEMGPALNSLFMFANASIQSNYRILKAFKKSKKVRQITGSLFAAGLAHGFAMRFLDDEDEDGIPSYDKTSRFHQNHNIMIPRGDGKYFRVPLPYGINIFWALGQTLSEVLYHGGGYGNKPIDYTDLGMELADTVLNSVNPLGGSGHFLATMTPTLARPAVELALNKDFMGRDIRKEQFPFAPEKPDSEMYFHDVYPATKWITKQLNELGGGDSIQKAKLEVLDINPETLDYLWDYYTGGVGRFSLTSATTLADLVTGNADKIEERDIPIARRFVTQASEYYSREAFKNMMNAVDIATDVYDTYRETDADRATRYYESKKNLLQLAPRLKATENSVAALRRKRNALYKNKDLTEEQREDTIESIKEQEMTLIYKALRQYYK